MSRLHARIRWDDERRQYRIEDCGSHNGTFLNGQPVDRAPLAPGDLLRTGSSLWVVDTFDRHSQGWVPPPACQMAGRSRALRQVLEQIERAATRSIRVVSITGPTGVGKELAARYYHRMTRRRGSFVPVNCAAIPADVFEAEVFGYERGAFTGARAPHRGLVRVAAGGTLFLDEVGELPLQLQAKLLRLLELGEVRPVGATRTERVDVRVVCATNRDLLGAVEVGILREDFAARLMEWVIEVPPLAERKCDILPIAYRELRRIVGPDGHLKGFNANAAEALVMYPWPRNVRELVHAVGRAVAEAPPDEELIPRAALPRRIAAYCATALDAGNKAASTPSSGSHGPARRPGPPSTPELAAALEAAGGNVSEVARSIGVSRMQVYRWLRASGIDPRVFRRK